MSKFIPKLKHLTNFNQRRFEIINEVAEMFRQGLTEEEIRKALLFFYTPKRVYDYIATAKMLLQEEELLKQDLKEKP